MSRQFLEEFLHVFFVLAKIEDLEGEGALASDFDRLIGQNLDGDFFAERTHAERGACPVDIFLYFWVPTDSRKRTTNRTGDVCADRDIGNDFLVGSRKPEGHIFIVYAVPCETRQFLTKT